MPSGDKGTETPRANTNGSEISGKPSGSKTEQAQRSGPTQTLREAISRARNSLLRRSNEATTYTPSRDVNRDLTPIERSRVSEEFGGKRQGESFQDADRRYDQAAANIRTARNSADRTTQIEE